MARLLLGIVVAVVAFTVYAVIDAAMIDRSRVRGVPRWAWILIILFIPVIGGALWFLIGRGRRNARPVPRSFAPDDDPEFLRSLGSEAEREERIRRLEQELAELDDPAESGDDAGPASRPRPDDAKPASQGRADDAKPASQGRADDAKPASHGRADDAKPASQARAEEAKPAPQARPDENDPPGLRDA